MATLLPFHMAAAPVRHSILCNYQKVVKTSITRRGWNTHANSSRVLSTNHGVGRGTSILPRKCCQPSPSIASYSTPSWSNETTSPSVQKFSFKIAASYVAKDKNFNPEKNVFRFEPSSRNFVKRLASRVQQPQKIERPATGEDAFFVSQVGETSDIALGIADGVGGWASTGINPADFSHGICHHMRHVASNYLEKEWGDPNLSALALMKRGYEDLCLSQSVLMGSSTACVAVMRTDGLLDVANLGDSGYVQLRLNDIHSYSEPQTYDFNTPYQLSIIPDPIKRRNADFGCSNICNLPQDANILQHQLRHGDILVLGSDGLWDNLSRSEVLKIVSRNMFHTGAWEYTSANGVSVDKNPTEKSCVTYPKTNDGLAPRRDSLQEALAVNITYNAKAASINTKRNGPFAREMEKYYPEEEWSGGKVDDICVIVAIVHEESMP